MRSEDMAAVNEAWGVLGDDEARHAYDESLGIVRPTFFIPVAPDAPPGFGVLGPGYRMWNAPPKIDRSADPPCVQLALAAMGNDLSGLDQMENRQLWRLDLRRTDVDDDALQAIVRFNCLEHLDLANTRVTDASVPRLATLPKLRVLNLAECTITDAAVAGLAAIPTLEELSLFGTKVTDAGIEALAFHPVLAILDLRDTAVTTDGLPPILTIPELHELRLPHRALKAHRRIAELRPDVRVL
ncbi:MAG: hypothetical protein QOJ00_1284 [Actinomycetota bacterium]